MGRLKSDEIIKVLEVLIGEVEAALIHKGYRALLIDLDAQRNLTAAAGAKLTGYNITHLLEGSATAKQVIQHTRNGDIITASPFLAGADIAMTSDKELKRAIGPILNDYDYILIDTPANYGKWTRNALTAATSAIITAQAATFSLQGLKEIIDIVEQIKAANPVLKLRGVLITNYSGRSNKVKQLVEDLKDRDAVTARRINSNYIFNNFEQKNFDAAIELYRGEVANNLYYYESLGDIGAEEIRKEIERHINYKGSSPIVFIDYLQIMKPINENWPEKRNIDKAVIELRKIARDYNITIFAISSLNRGSYNGDIGPEAFKESGGIVYGAMGIKAEDLEEDANADAKKCKRS